MIDSEALHLLAWIRDHLRKTFTRFAPATVAWFAEVDSLFERIDGAKKTNQKKRRCYACDATIVEYRHTLGLGLVSALHKFARTGSPLNVHRHLGLTTNQWDNFQKLRYWDLVAKCYDEEGKRIQGLWSLTDVAVHFLQGKKLLPRAVWTYRGVVQRFDSDLISVDDVDVGYRLIEDYIADSVPHFSEGLQ